MRLGGNNRAQCEMPTICCSCNLGWLCTRCSELFKLLPCSYVRVNTEGTLQSDEYATLRECGDRVLHGHLRRGIPGYKAPEGGVRQPAGMHPFFFASQGCAVVLRSLPMPAQCLESWPGHLQVGARNTSRAAGGQVAQRKMLTILISNKPS